MPAAAARSCNSQWPLATHTEQTWLRSANSSSTIIRRYSRSFGGVGVDVHPLGDLGDAGGHAACGVPAISTRQSRQAPTSETPSRWHSVGMRDAGRARRGEDRLAVGGGDQLGR